LPAVECIALASTRKQTGGKAPPAKKPAQLKSTAPRQGKDGTTEIETLARSHAAAAVAALAAVMDDAAATPSARIAAAGALLQWGFGKPALPGAAARAELLKTIEGGETPQLIRLAWAAAETKEEPSA
jgi:hypothetical protein